MKQKVRLPAIQVKLSSQAAKTVSITQVAVRDLTTRGSIEDALTITRKDAPRIRAILRRGVLVSTGPRFLEAGGC